jgi:hypothetical protein
MSHRISQENNIELYTAGVAAGCVGTDAPAITDNGNGTYDLASFEVLLYDNPTHEGKLQKFIMSAEVARSVTDTPNEVRYIVADYNGGNPIVRDLTFGQLSQINESTIVPVYTMYVEYDAGAQTWYLHPIPWDTLGQGLPNMTHTRLVKTDRFARESGLSLSVTDPAQSIQLSASKIYLGSVPHSIEEFDSSSNDGDRLYWWYNSGVGLTVTITVSAGVVQTVTGTPIAGGTGYVAGTEITLTGVGGAEGNGDAVISIDTVTAATGEVTAVSLVQGGTGYTTAGTSEVYQGWLRQVWTDGTGVYNNTHYDGGDGVGVLPLGDTPQDFGINWIYRDLQAEPHAGFVLAPQAYDTFAEAIAAQPRNDLPPEFGVIAYLSGRIIVEQGETVATSSESAVESAFDQTFEGTAVTSHNSLSGVQGGLAGEYYHLSEDLNTAVVDGVSAWTGSIVEQFSATVTSNGTDTTTVNLERSGGGDLRMQFSDGFTILDCTPPQTITIANGTDTVPVASYVYIPIGTKVLTTSTVGWPTAEEHIKIGYFMVFSPARTLADAGALINQNWNEERLTTEQGHFLHLSEWVRGQSANWFSGCEGDGTSEYLTITGGVGATFHVATGVISQLHKHTFVAKDTSAGDDAHVVNHPTAWLEVSDMNQILVDSTNTSLTGRYFNIFLAGVANKGGTYSPLLIGLPSGSYGNAADAIADVDGYDDFQLPREFTKESSTGFLIARLTIQNTADTTFTLHNTHDLRGQVIYTGGTGGSGATPGGADTYVQFNDGSNFGGDAGFTYDKNTDSTTIAGTYISSESGKWLENTTTGLQLNSSTYDYFQLSSPSLRMSWQNGGTALFHILRTSGNFGNVTSYGSGTKMMGLTNTGTQPTVGTSDQVAVFGTDIVAGDCGLGIIAEGNNITKIGGTKATFPADIEASGTIKADVIESLSTDTTVVIRGNGTGTVQVDDAFTVTGQIGCDFVHSRQSGVDLTLSGSGVGHVVIADDLEVQDIITTTGATDLQLIAGTSGTVIARSDDLIQFEITSVDGLSSYMYVSGGLGLSIDTGDAYMIGGTTVLSSSSLGSTVLSSSLTTVGTITNGTWQSTDIGVAYGGTGQSTYTNGQLLIGNTTGSTLAKNTLTGTASQITVTNGAGTITLSTPQSIATNSNVQFNKIGAGTAGAGANGEIRATNNITAYYSSDARLKENVVTITNALEKVTQLNGVTFDWTDEYIEEHGGEDGYFIRKGDVGLIAQEVEAVLPEIVADKEDGYKAIKYDRLVALLVEAVKDLKAEIDDLKSK